MSKVDIIQQLKVVVQENVIEILKRTFNQEDVDPSIFKFETPPDDKMGHLAFACFPLARILRKGPPVIASEIKEQWGDTDYFSNVEAVGPYLNFYFNPAWLAKETLITCLENDGYGDSDIGAGKRLMLEYSSPNTNKPLHLGHGRNNLLGSVLARLLEKTGHEVVKVNLVNDRGIHICKSMYAYQNWGNGETPESIGKKGDKLVGEFYVTYDKKEKENPDILKDVQEMLRDWENDEPEVVDLWKRMNQWVMEGFHETYDRMNVTFDRFYYESQTYKKGKELVLDAHDKGLCLEEDNGAIAIDLEKEDLGKKILLRGDGTSVYITQDIGTTVTKFSDYDLDGCLFVVANEQDFQFRVLFTILEKFGYEWADRCEHISYGMIALPEGKMKSREGTVVELDDLLDEMKSLALEEIRSRGRSDEVAAKADLETTAEAIGQAAIAYLILKTNANKEIIFNPKESISFDGATGPYLQYTHARICSLLDKADAGQEDSDISGYSWNENETRLLVALSRFPDVIETSAVDRNPATLCVFVYELCRLFNKFYYDNPILKADDPITVAARLTLTRGVQRVLKKSLEILGIRPLERM